MHAPRPTNQQFIFAQQRCLSQIQQYAARLEISSAESSGQNEQHVIVIGARATRSPQPQQSNLAKCNNSTTTSQYRFHE
jgi:hypothetical protein